jgi:hypothetical protein
MDSHVNNHANDPANKHNKNRDQARKDHVDIMSLDAHQMG